MFAEFEDDEDDYDAVDEVRAASRFIFESLVFRRIINPRCLGSFFSFLSVCFRRDHVNAAPLSHDCLFSPSLSLSPRACVQEQPQEGAAAGVGLTVPPVLQVDANPAMLMPPGTVRTTAPPLTLQQPTTIGAGLGGGVAPGVGVTAPNVFGVGGGADDYDDYDDVDDTGGAPGSFSQQLASAFQQQPSDPTAASGEGGFFGGAEGFPTAPTPASVVVPNVGVGSTHAMTAAAAMVVPTVAVPTVSSMAVPMVGHPTPSPSP